MASWIKKTLKSTALGAAVGAALSFVLPGFAEMIGAPEAIGYLNNAVWNAGFFGMISGLTTALEPVFTALFEENTDKGSTGAEPQPAQAREPCLAPAVEPSSVHVERLNAATLSAQPSVLRR